MTNEPRQKDDYVIRNRYILALDGMGIAAAFVLAVLLRFESFSAATELLSVYWPLILVSIVARVVINLCMGLYARIWRYASAREEIQILIASTLGTAVMLLINFVALPLLLLPAVSSVSLFLLDWILNTFFMSGSRFVLRSGLNWLAAHRKRNVLNVLSPHRRVLIAGAGHLGTTLARMIQDKPEMGFEVVGFIDDDPYMHNKNVQGHVVLGGRDDIPSFVKEKRAREVIIAMPKAQQHAIDEIVAICNSASIGTRIIPSIFNFLTGEVTVDQMRQWRTKDEYASETPGVHVHTQPANPPTFRRIMVTGGAGFIGANFVRYMLETYPQYSILVYDLLTYAGNPDNLLGLAEEYPGRYSFVKGDICDYEHVSATIRRFEIDMVINFAAESHVDRSLMDPHNFLRTNVDGTHALLEACRQIGVKRYHQVSTDEVYGQVARGSFTEQDPLETRSPYSASKASADLLVHAYQVSFGVQATITRGSNNIGPYQYPEKAVPLFVTNAMDNLPLPVYGDGLYVRDYQHVLDHCRGIDTVLHRGIPGEIYNLGGGNERTTIELAEAILARLGKPRTLIHLVDDRAGQDRRYSVNCAKIRSLGWQPQWTFERSLDETIKWYQDNEWWWRKIKNGDYQQYYAKQFDERLENSIQLAAV